MGLCRIIVVLIPDGGGEQHGPLRVRIGAGRLQTGQVLPCQPEKMVMARRLGRPAASVPERIIAVSPFGHFFV